MAGAESALLSASAFDGCCEHAPAADEPRSGEAAVSTHRSADDSAVIARSLSEPDAFAVIFERHFDEILRYLRRRFPAEAEELAADTFIVAFDRRESYQALGDSARPWLYGIASNLLHKRRRREARSLRAYARSAGRDGPPSNEFADAIERLDAERQSAALARALGRLRAEDRDTLLLYSLGALSYEEVALALAVPVGTVRSRLARARRRCAPELLSLTTEEARPHG
jgi:RNA polymerase sigma factor (sigma-70 family)